MKKMKTRNITLVLRLLIVSIIMQISILSISNYYWAVNQPKWLQIDNFIFRGEVKLSSISAYPNLFQTSNANKGIRVELNSDNQLYAVVGTGKKVGPESFKVYNFPGNIVLGTKYKIMVRYSMHNKALSLGIDDMETLFTDEALSPEFDNILIGSGLSGSRTWSGTIENVTNYYNADTTRTFSDKIIVIAMIGLFLFQFGLFIVTIILRTESKVIARLTSVNDRFK